MRFARQVARPTLLARINVALGQQSQPQQVPQIPRIGEVPAVLQPFVLLDRTGVCQIHPVARIHQPIHQPVPVVRALDDHARQLLPIRLQCRPDLPQIVRQPLLQRDPIFLVNYHHDTIVRVQVYAAIFHLGLLRVKVQSSHLDFNPAA